MTDQLPPLPEPEAHWVDGKDQYGYDTYEHAFSADQMIEYARASLAQQSAPTFSAATALPDGSAFATASWPLPKDHWLYAPRGEWDNARDECVECPTPLLNNSHTQAVRAAIKYAIRGATMCGQEQDFDPDALVQNAVYALCGPANAAVLPVDAPAPQQAAPALTDAQVELLAVAAQDPSLTDEESLAVALAYSALKAQQAAPAPKFDSQTGEPLIDGWPLFSALPPAQQAAPAQPEPLFLLHCGKIDGDGEQDDWETEADSGQRVDDFARRHPGKTIGLYALQQAAPAVARQPLTDEQIDMLALDADGLPNSHLEFARAIEAAHGITAAPTGEDAA